MKKIFRLSLLLIFAVLLLIGLYFVPPIHQRLAWRIENLITSVVYMIHPPDQAVFVPLVTAKPVYSLTSRTTPGRVGEARTTLTPFRSRLNTPTRIPTIVITSTPTLSPTPLPTSVTLTGITFEYQSFNNCGPANLAMLLSFWGWQGDQRDTKAILRPNDDDANVMPEEMVEFVTQHTTFKAVLRIGGTLDTLRAFLAAGFPVIIESGHQPQKDWWLGHYILVSGYDDAAAHLVTQDSLIMPDLPVPYSEIQATGWRDFNETYLVVYPAEREAQVLALLGADADPTENLRRALARAQSEVDPLEGRDRFFAQYNVGSIQLALGDVDSAVAAFDQAFTLYPTLEEKQRPWRVTWYRVDPYEAYYRAGRYQDVINLANSTLAWLSKRGLEESHYWRGMAYEATGDPEKAIEDYQIALKLRPTFALAQEALKRLKP